MPKRKAISKKQRFEVFKRDAFKCQYCGQGAPEAILQVDHIKPVSKSGDNNIMNLITSCDSCNQGKGSKLIDDNTALEKQRKQLEELNERREQLEMMMEWREGLVAIAKKEVEIVNEFICRLTGYKFTESGKINIKKHVKKYGLNAVLDALEISHSQYYDDSIPEKSSEKVVEYIPKICHIKSIGKEKPYLQELFYIRGILRNRLSYYDKNKCLSYLEAAYLKGASMESLRELVMEASTWTAFRKSMEEYLEGE